MNKLRRIVIAAAVFALAATIHGAAFTPGNLVIYRMGDGAAALSANGTPVFLDEYTTAGVLVQSIAVPTTTVGAQRRLVCSGSATSEGWLTRSTDGQYIVFPGYDAAVGTANITTSPSATVPRVIGRAGASGTLDTSTALTDAISGGNPRGAASTNGTDLWISGTSSGGGIRYATFGATTSTALNTATVTNLRSTAIFGGQLYVSANSGAFRLATVGTGTPTTTGQTITNLPGFPTATTTPYQFFFADLDAGVAGVDTVYVADDSGFIRKYSLVAGNWTANSTIALTNVRGLTGSVSGSNVTLFITARTTLQTLTDTSGYNATITGSLTSLATAATNTAMQGVAFVPGIAGPTLSINDVSLNEGNAGTTSFTFTVSLSAPAGPGGVTFDIATADGTATQPSDYTQKSLTSQTIPAGNSTYSFTALVNGDTTPETNETFFVNVTNVTGATVTDGQGQGTIQNDDIAPNLTINDVTLAEGNAGTTTFTFTVSLSAPAGAGGVTFDIATANSTATAPSDYTAKSLTSQTIPSGSNSYTFDVLVNGDTTPETNETFFVNVTNITNAIGTDTQGLGTITNDDFTPIHNIQGNGDTSPLVGQSVTTKGIVTGVKSNGYFIEAPDVEWDADPNTSEGVFVFTSSAPPAAAVVGNLVSVVGTVQEFIPSSDTFSPATTEISGSPVTSLISSGNPLPTAITLTTADTNPAGTLTQMEKYEGMRVHVNTLNVVGPTQGTVSEANATSTSNGTFYGVLPGINRPFREPGIQANDPIPNPPCCIPTFDFNPERLRVDSDAIGGTVIDVTAGATVTNLTGPMDYGFRTYTIDPEPATVPGVSGNVTFTPVPAPLATEFTVGCQNLERFFDDVADGNGAVTLTTTAWNNRKNKASLLIRNVLRAPDILGVEEAETLTGLQSLAAKINADAIAAAQPNPNYTAYLINGNDVGGINVGFLVNSTRVTVNSVAQAAGSASATYTDPTSGNPALIWDRPPLVLDATVIGPPAVPIVVIVNHLRSLNGIDDPTVSGLSTTGDRVRQKRRAGAEWLANYIQGRMNVNSNERLVLVGDFNAFEFNDGYVDVMGTIVGTPTPSTNVLLASSDLVNPDLINLSTTGPAAQQYSYNFDGDAQSIDHSLINTKAAANFSRFAHGRVDADFPEAYRSDSTRPERLSDHDGEVTYFSLTPTIHFDIGIPASVTQGVSFTGTVTAKDALNNVVTGYNGTVHFTSSDGGAALPVDYTFNGGDAGTHTFTNGFTLFAAGSQSITATDTLSPTITGTANTTVTCPAVNATASNNGPICQGGTLQLDTINMPGATYSWTGPNGFTAAVRNPSISNAQPAASGLYSVTIDNAGCIYNASTTATVDTMPTTPTITADTNGTGTQDQACPEQPLTLHANSTGATSYQWFSNNDTLNGETGSTYQATGAATYYVVAVNGSCTTPQSAGYVVQNPTPHTPFITIRNQNSSVTSIAICQGSSIILDSDSATGIHWWKDNVDLGPGSQSLTVTGSTPGTFVYTAQLNALGCHSTFGRNITVTVDALPPTPTISGDTNGTGTQDQACPEQPLTLHANGATGAQSYTWYSDNAVIPNETTSTLVMTGVGNISVTATNGTCTTAHSATYVVQNPTPHAPFITIRNQPSTTTSIAVCQGTSVILDSDSATGIQWWKDGQPIAGPQQQSLTVTASGVYTAQLNALGCHSQFGRDITVTVNPLPETPTITPNGPTTFCAGGSVTLQSSSATGNQWYLNNAPINGQTAQTLVASAAGDYTVVVTDGNNCSSAASAVTTVLVNPNPNATITAPGAVQTGTTGNTASVANAGAGASYNWSITNGTITAGTGTNSITFTAGAVGTLTLNVTVTDANGCTDSKSANVTVTATTPGLTITSVVPSAGLITGGKPVTINGTGFANGATVTFGGSAATNVVVVNATKITAKTPAHAGGAVNVTVTNPNNATATLTNGYTYVPTQFDANGDHVVDPADIFFLVNYLFLGGPAPMGQAGIDSGDANGDGVVDPADIFYLIQYLYLHGPAPMSQPPRLSAQSVRQPVAGSVSLGEPVRRGSKFVVPVIVDAENAEALALRVVFAGDPVGGAAIHSVRGIKPVFEISRSAPGSLAFLLAVDGRVSGVVAEIEVEAAGRVAIDVDPALTLLSGAGGTRKATVAGGTLRVSGTTIGDNARPDRKE
jgi:uncharacterized protein